MKTLIMIVTLLSLSAVACSAEVAPVPALAIAAPLPEQCRALDAIPEQCPADTVWIVACEAPTPMQAPEACANAVQATRSIEGQPYTIRGKWCCM